VVGRRERFERFQRSSDRANRLPGSKPNWAGPPGKEQQLSRVQALGRSRDQADPSISGAGSHQTPGGKQALCLGARQCGTLVRGLQLPYSSRVIENFHSNKDHVDSRHKAQF
jgi:hypothetical protein